MIRCVVAAFLSFGLLVSGASAQSCSVPNTFTSGTTASAAQVNANFAALLSCVNSPSFASITAPQGRLTLAANTPVMSSTSCSGSACTAQTTLRYDCYAGGQVPFYNGTADAIDSITSCEVTDALVAATGAGQVVGAQVYDVWWVHGGANGICLAMSSATGAGGGWASDTGGSNTARGTGYTQLDRVTRPYVTNKNSIANCFNGSSNYGPVSANQGTYLGTVYASANGAISYKFGSAASGGGAGLLGVWNMYNRVTTTTTVQDNGAGGYTYSSSTIRQARASTGNQVTFVIGNAEDAVSCSYGQQIDTAAVSGASGRFACSQLNSTTAFYLQNSTVSSNAAVGQAAALSYSNSYPPPLGLNVIAAVENGDGTNANTFDPNAFANLTVTIRN
jgi:hypothetical protein